MADYLPLRCLIRYDAAEPHKALSTVRERLERMEAVDEVHGAGAR
jgi:hypothetical protein